MRDKLTERFSVERVTVWALGIIGAGLTFAFIRLSIEGMEIPPSLPTVLVALIGHLGTVVQSAVKNRGGSNGDQQKGE